MIDGLRGQLDELLGIPLDVVESPTIYEDSVDTAPCKLRPVLKLGENVGECDVGLVQDDSRRPGDLGCLHTRLTDVNVGLAPLQPGPWDRRRCLQRGSAFVQQGFVVEGHPENSLVFDAIP